MIETIRASVTFPINGIHLNMSFSPPPGITAVTGKNGSGKTFAGSEMPRYLLWGKAALRGTAGDYKNLEADGWFVIAGKRYLIERTPKKEQISDDTGEVLAVGAKAVTAEVERLFGYGREVFDICNASTQKNADMFGKMMPAERKRMIDRVVGLTSYEAVEKSCRDEAKNLRQHAEAMTRTLRAPVEPVEPENYVSACVLFARVAEARVARAAAQAICDRIRPAHEAVAPASARPAVGEVEKLEQHEQDRLVAERERTRLQGIVQTYDAYDIEDWSEDQLVAAEARLVVRAEIVARGVRPTMTIGDIMAQLDVWDEIAFTSKINREEVTCPKCDHVFLTGRDVPPAPATTRAELGRQLNEHRAWDKPEPELPHGPDLTQKEIHDARAARVAKGGYAAAQSSLSALPVLNDQSTTLKETRTSAAHWLAYDVGMQRAVDQLKANIAAEADLRKLGNFPAQATLDQWSDDLADARVYEAAKEEARRMQTEFSAVSAEIAQKTEMAVEFTKGATAIADARTTLKAHLAPSLSRVASSLIDEMTNGELHSVIVDENMEITVNGQRIETLSGAGVTVANIALRIGLGQVLVANTFPVFLGDEMDSDADEARRAATTEAIGNLRSRLTQIILITHRDVSIADQVLDVTR